MPFHEDYRSRGNPIGLKGLTSGCKQIFNNLVVTPTAQLSACCGLTFEHIPELKIGNLHENSMAEIFERASTDFLKIWLHVDGPGTILRKLFGTSIDDELKNVRHICEACAIMHQNPIIREAIATRAQDFAPDVLARFELGKAFAGLRASNRIDTHAAATTRQE